MAKLVVISFVLILFPMTPCILNLTSFSLIHYHTDIKLFYIYYLYRHFFIRIEGVKKGSFSFHYFEACIDIVIRVDTSASTATYITYIEKIAT
jgi:hypothetical protein